MDFDFDAIVLYCDNHLLVVNKPAGLLSQGDRSGDDDLLSAAKRYLKKRFDKPGRVYVGLVHRLDRPVSGVMVLARTSKAASRLSAQFRDRETEKKYVALVEGNPEFSGTTSGYLKKAVEGVKAADRDEAGAQYSELSWDTIARPDRGTLLNVTLVTGRKHQIRHQFAAIGHPIVGDRRYGSKQSFHGRNIALHCYLLALDHPTRAQRMRWTASPPDEWDSDAESVRKWMDSRGYRPDMIRP